LANEFATRCALFMKVCDHDLLTWASVCIACSIHQTTYRQRTSSESTRVSAA